MLTYFANWLSQVKRSAEESWPRYSYFCITTHLIIGHMLDKLLYLNANLKKCATHHILLTTFSYHQLKISVCRGFSLNLQTDGNHWVPTQWLPSVCKFKEKPLQTEIFNWWRAQVDLCHGRVDEKAVKTVSFYWHWKTPWSLPNVHRQIWWICWQIKCARLSIFL